MRCFIAIDIGERVRMALGDLQRKLQSATDIKKSDVKWVKPDNIHLTLKFLGEIRDEAAVEVCNIVKDVAGRHKSFDVNVESVGYFGGRSARVLWVGGAPETIICFCSRRTLRSNWPRPAGRRKPENSPVI